MPRRSRRRRRDDGVALLLILALAAILLLVLVNNGSITLPGVQVPDLNLPAVDIPDIDLPHVAIPITGLPKIEVPAFRVPVTVEPGDLIPDIEVNGTAGPLESDSGLIAPQTKTGGCRLQGSLPDPGCTPGAVTTTDMEEVCAPDGAGSTQNVTGDEREAVYNAYGIPGPARDDYQVDHLVPPSLGGSNSSANLWPQPSGPRPGAAEKDQLERYLHDQVCQGQLTLEEAQRQIAANWLAAYERMPD